MQQGPGQSDAAAGNEMWSMQAHCCLMLHLPQLPACQAPTPLPTPTQTPAVNGVPSCINKELLTDRLRGELGFDGFVVTDCTGEAGVSSGCHHGWKLADATGMPHRSRLLFVPCPEAPNDPTSPHSAGSCGPTGVLPSLKSVHAFLLPIVCSHLCTRSCLLACSALQPLIAWFSHRQMGHTWRAATAGGRQSKQSRRASTWPATCSSA